MIEVRNLTKLYGSFKAIEDVSFQVQKGEVVGFLGPNGAGKTTTMRIITGAMAPTDGQALIDGVDVFEDPIRAKAYVGYLPETPPVYLDMRVEDYLNFVAELKRVPASHRRQAVEKAMEKTQLPEVRRRVIGNLSKGFRQRVGIAAAIVADPPVLILDEPTVGLDPRQVLEIRQLIKDLRGQHTIILSTHILSEVEATCDRAIIIHKGRVVAQDTIEGLKKARSQGANAVFVKLRDKSVTAAQLSQALGSLSVTDGSQVGEFVVRINDPQQMDQIALRVIEKGWGLEHLSQQAVHLEDVFIQLTYGNAHSNGTMMESTATV